MDHAYIEEHEIADRYVMGKLPVDEAARFEEHYLSCPRCLDRLELAESMERGFKRAAGQDAARIAAARQLAVVAWLSRLGRSRQAAALLMALFVVVVLPAGLALREIGERNQELADARAALTQERARERERTTAGSGRAAEAERLRSELAARQRELDREREARAEAAEQLAEASRPQGNVPILFLGAERSVQAGAEPTHRLRLPQEPGWIVLALEVDPPHAASYRAVLRGPDGRELWRGEGLELNEMETLALSLPSSLLAPGDHILTVEGMAPGRRPAAAGRFAFRVLPAA